MKKRPKKLGISIKNSRVIKAPKKVFETVKSRIATAVAAAFAFVIALTWNDTIRKGVDTLVKELGLTGPSYFYSLLAALVITVICVAGMFNAAK